MAPVSKEAQEVRLPFSLSVLFAGRALERGVPEHQPVANRKHAKAPTSPPRLTGNARGDVLLLEVGDSSPTGVAARVRVRLAQQLLADHGIQSICADQQVLLQLLPIGEVTNDMPLL
jgi:hypothetical protein